MIHKKTGGRMATFVFHIDGEKLEFDDIRDGAIKSLIAEVKSVIDSQLKSQQCRVHHLGPAVALFSQNGQFSGYTLGTCCKTFGELIASLVEVRIPGNDSAATRVTRSFKYSSNG
jgi:hypothetical protein